MHHPQDEAPERYLVKILLSSMEAHLPQGQEEEDEDENDWGIASVSCILGTAKLIFKFWKPYSDKEWTTLIINSNLRMKMTAKRSEMPNAIPNPFCTSLKKN